MTRCLVVVSVSVLLVCCVAHVTAKQLRTNEGLDAAVLEASDASSADRLLSLLRPVAATAAAPASLRRLSGPEPVPAVATCQSSFSVPSSSSAAIDAVCPMLLPDPDASKICSEGEAEGRRDDGPDSIVFDRPQTCPFLNVTACALGRNAFQCTASACWVYEWTDWTECTGGCSGSRNRARLLVVADPSGGRSCLAEFETDGCVEEGQRCDDGDRDRLTALTVLGVVASLVFCVPSFVLTSRRVCPCRLPPPGRKKRLGKRSPAKVYAVQPSPGRDDNDDSDDDDSNHMKNPKNQSKNPLRPPPTNPNPQSLKDLYHMNRPTHLYKPQPPLAFDPINNPEDVVDASNETEPVPPLPTFFNNNNNNNNNNRSNARRMSDGASSVASTMSFFSTASSVTAFGGDSTARSGAGSVRSSRSTRSTRSQRRRQGRRVTSPNPPQPTTRRRR